MTKQEALQKIEELKAFIEQEENKPWRPKHNENYYYISEWGDVHSNLFYESCGSDRERLQIGNCFKTEELAEKSFKFWAMNKSEYEYSLPYAPETWFDDYTDTEFWAYEDKKWFCGSSLDSKEKFTYRRKRK